MKKTIIPILSIGMLLLLVALPSASAATCVTTGNYAQLVALGSTGCTLGPGGDKLFNNFTFLGGGTGTVPSAASLTYLTENPGTSTQTGQEVFGFIFNPAFSVSGTTNQTLDGLLNYDITCVTGDGCINSIHLFEVATASGGGVASVSETDLGCVAVGNCSFINDAVSTSGTVGLHNDVLGLRLISLHVNKDINVTTGNVAGGFATISAVRDSVDQIPEPATYSYLLGGGLLLFLGGLRRRKA